MTTFDAVPTIAWNVGALPAPFDVSTWPAVPADELSTPVALLSTTPAPRPLNVIVPDEVRPVRLLRVPAIVLAAVIVSFTGLPTVRSPTDWSVEFTTVACVLRPIEI